MKKLKLKGCDLEMKRKLLSSLISVLIMCFALSANAQTWPDSLVIEFHFEGFGNVVMDSPPIYAGDITGGDARVNGGTWWIQIDDSEWPDVTDPSARWQYIFDNYYVYDPGSYSWTAVFDGNSLPTKPTWEINHSVNGMMGGTLVSISTIVDMDMDGVLDLDERTFGTFGGTMMVMKYGTGNFAKYCGLGSYDGYFMNADPANFPPDFVEGDCLLDLINCEVDNEMASWSDIKTLHR